MSLIGFVAVYYTNDHVQVFSISKESEYKKYIMQGLKRQGTEVIVAWKGHYYECVRNGGSYDRVELSPGDPRIVCIPDLPHVGS